MRTLQMKFRPALSDDCEPASYVEYDVVLGVQQSFVGLCARSGSRGIRAAFPWPLFRKLGNLVFLCFSVSVCFMARPIPALLHSIMVDRLFRV